MADTEGWTFTASQGFEITALDYYPNGASLSSAHKAGIWTSNGTLLASTTIPSGTPAEMSGLYESVAIVPFALGPGTYVIGATVGGGPDLTIFRPDWRIDSRWNHVWERRVHQLSGGIAVS